MHHHSVVVFVVVVIIIIPHIETFSHHQIRVFIRSSKVNTIVILIFILVCFVHVFIKFSIESIHRFNNVCFDIFVNVIINDACNLNVTAASVCDDCFEHRLRISHPMVVSDATSCSSSST